MKVTYYCATSDFFSKQAVLCGIVLSQAKSNKMRLKWGINRKLYWLLQRCTYRCSNELIHLVRDYSNERPSLRVYNRLLTSRCLYTALHQARFVHCLCWKTGLYIHRLYCTHQDERAITTFCLKMATSSAKVTSMAVNIKVGLQCSLVDEIEILIFYDSSNIFPSVEKNVKFLFVIETKKWL